MSSSTSERLCIVVRTGTKEASRPLQTCWEQVTESGIAFVPCEVSHELMRTTLAQMLRDAFAEPGVVESMLDELIGTNEARSV